MNKLNHPLGEEKIHEVKRYNKKFKLIDESYNANPLSVKNALKNLSKIKKIKKIKKVFNNWRYVGIRKKFQYLSQRTFKTY